MAKALPTIPYFPGIPPLMRPPNWKAEQVLSIGVALGVKYLAKRQTWGIFDKNGNDLFRQNGLAESLFSSMLGSAYAVAVMGVVVSAQSVTTNAPVENGSFAMTNKVITPITPTVSFRMQGTDQQKRAFLSILEEARTGVDLYSIVTPYQTYANHTVIGYNVTHSNQTGNVIVVDIMLQEIREIDISFAPADPKDPKDKQEKSSGMVQGATPTDTVKAKIMEKLQ